MTNTFFRIPYTFLYLTETVEFLFFYFEIEVLEIEVKNIANEYNNFLELEWNI